ncbi:protein kinase [Streptomyces sp900105245]|uniref:protein kinase domain-containing protein n=1 Tax=Streptomyces sp. 900105245 TaxID=3154379 RepID=UPI003324C282
MDQATEVFQPLQADDPPVVAGYRLAARLGAGGMGRVYLAHTRGGRPVAVKVVRPELADDPDFRRRFGREIKAARRVRGAYTAELIDADADAVPPWLATLYVPGPSLTEAVARRGPLPVTAVLWLMAGVAEALQAIHAEGVVHRDLKPSNVLLAADGPRVIDFGIALAADGTSYTATGGTIGTPSFMAPEQASGADVTAATDVFALGQTAAFAALGRPLYGEGAALNVLYRIVHSAPDLAALPEPLRPLFARCLAADPAERATPAEIVQWCRQRLGADADAGGGPAVWREITGPEVTVPAPVPDPTPAVPQPLIAYPQPPTVPQGGARRRRALITGAGVAGGALLAVALAWSLMDAGSPAGGKDADGARTSATGPAARPSSSSSPAPAKGSADPAAGRTGDGKAGTSPSPAASPPRPRADVYAPLTVDAQHPLNLDDPDGGAKNGKDAVRFDCREPSCELTSGTASFVQIVGGHGTTLDMCRLMLRSGRYHDWTLASVATGSEICMKDTKGNVALFVVRTKSTAIADLAFLQGDLTVWRKAA